MKLLVLKTLPPQKNNGGEIGNFERFRLLKALGWEIQIEVALNTKAKDWACAIMQKFGAVEKESQWIMDHIPCRLHFDEKFNHNESEKNSRMHEFFYHLLKRENPDLAWAQYTDYAAACGGLLWNPDRMWLDICDNEFKRVLPMSLDKNFIEVSAFYHSIRHIVVASPFMQRICQKDFPEAKIRHLPYPMPELRYPTAKQDRKFWLFINPVAMKGLEVMLKIAKELPAENFAFVRNWAMKDELENLPPNVTLVPQQQTLKPLFVHSKGLLMPSLWDEAFGRVPLEAMAASVPVITSNRGALPETVGTGGVVLPPEDLKKWLEVLQNPDPRFWENLVLRGHERVQEYLRMCEGVYGEMATMRPKLNKLS